jgi:hypothetical protein
MKKNKNISLEEKIADWEPEPRKAPYEYRLEPNDKEVNYVDLCQKLQNALAKSYVENEDQQKEMEFLSCLLSIKRKRVEQLESYLAIAITHGEFDLDDTDDEESLSEYLKARQ